MSQSLLGKRSRENLETRLSDEKGEIIGTLNKLNLHTVASESDWKNVSFDHILTDKDELERVQSMVDIFNQTRKKEPWGFLDICMFIRTLSQCFSQTETGMLALQFFGKTVGRFNDLEEWLIEDRLYIFICQFIQ